MSMLRVKEIAMEDLNKEFLEFGKSRCLPDSRIMELEDKVRDMSNVKFDLECRSEKLDKMLGTVQIKNDTCGLGFNPCNEFTHNAQTNVLGESSRKSFRD